LSKESLAPRVGVGVFIFKDGKFLMGKRVGAHGSGSWSVPGGWLEYAESFQDAAIREVEEETGLTITNVRFGALTNNIFADEQIHSLTVWMTSDWESGIPTILEPDKFVEQRWVSFDELPEPLFLPWQELLASEFIEPLRRYAHPA
jgi:8-oxo-dGTP diphosphatase